MSGVPQLIFIRFLVFLISVLILNYSQNLSGLPSTYLYSSPSDLISSKSIPIPFLQSIRVGSYTYLFIFQSSIPQTSCLSILKGIHIYLLFILYVSVLTYGYLYLLIYSHRTIWPRMFYRSGWLRCDVVKCIGLFWAGVYVLSSC